MRFLLLMGFFGAAVGLQAQDLPKLTLTWQDNSDNEDGFRVYRRIDGGAWLAWASVGANVEEWVDTAVSPGVTYGYQVTAFNSNGESARSNEASASVPAAGVAPSGPSGAQVVMAGSLVNVSTRGMVTGGDTTMIPGFSVTGGPVRALIRLVGPTIGQAPFNVPGVCGDPVLSLRDANGAEIGSNDNWSGAQVSEAGAGVGAFALPEGSRDAALVVTLPPGLYTVVARGAGGANGIALAEVYRLP